MLSRVSKLHLGLKVWGCQVLGLRCCAGAALAKLYADEADAMVSQLLSAGPPWCEPCSTVNLFAAPRDIIRWGCTFGLSMVGVTRVDVWPY